MLPTTPAALTAYVLGPFHVFVHGTPMPPLRAHSNAILLAYLLLHPDEALPRTTLTEMLWPDSLGDVARNNLNSALSVLRHALGSEAYRLHSPTKQTVRFDSVGACIDVQQFAAATEQRSARSLEEANALYRGPLLEGWGEEEREFWVLPLRDKWKQRCVQAVNQLTDIALVSGNLTGARHTLRRLVELDELEEAHWREMLQAMLDRKDYKAASQTYNELRTYKPSLETATKQLYAQIPLRERRKKLQRDQIRRKLLQLPRHLPSPLTDFLGRERAVQEIEYLLETERLVTLVGVGGIGKTTLGLEAAHRVAEDFADSAVWVELTAVTDAALLPHAVAATLRIAEVGGKPVVETLIEQLRSKHLLLTLDNCEHLIEACAELAFVLLRGCPHLHILATSREAFQVPGERRFDVNPLAVPPPPSPNTWRISRGKGEDLAELAECESVRLFVARAQVACPEFQLTRDNAEVMAAICVRLEGIPLAIELAAAQAILPLTEILAGLERRFEFLVSELRGVPPRHRSLQAALAYSVERLPEDLRRFFVRCAVFHGGWTVEAAREVCEEPAATNLLKRLCAVSLFSRQSRGETLRYRMLETVREFATERLEASGEAGQVRERHRHFFLKFVEQYDVEELKGDTASIAARIDSLEREHYNLLAAISSCWTEENAADTGLRLVRGTGCLWDVRGYISEARAYLAETLAHSHDQFTRTRRVAITDSAYAALHQNDLSAARSLYEESLLLARQMDDKAGMADSHIGPGYIEILEGNLTAAKKFGEVGLRLSREGGANLRIAQSLDLLGQVAINQKDYSQARSFFEEGIQVCREFGYDMERATCLYKLGCVAFFEGNNPEARAYLIQSLSIYYPAGWKLGVVWNLDIYANIANAERHLVRAVQFFSVAERLRQETGALPGTRWLTDIQNPLDAIRAALSPEAFETAWAEGYAMTTEEAVAYVVEEQKAKQIP